MEVPLDNAVVSAQRLASAGVRSGCTPVYYIANPEGSMTVSDE